VYVNAFDTNKINIIDVTITQRHTLSYAQCTGMFAGKKIIHGN